MYLKTTKLKLLSNPANNTAISILLHCLFFWVLYFVLLHAIAPLTPMFSKTWSRFMFGFFATLTTVLLVWLFLRHEKRTFKDIKLVYDSGTALRFVQGLLIGSAIFGSMLMALLLLTPLQLHLNTAPFELSALVPYLAFIPLSLMEEIGFRSYPFIKLNNQFGLRTTQLVVAIVFALAHVLGGQGVVSSFLGPGIWAFVFGLAAVWSGGIAMPFGIHLALNLLQPLTGMRGDSVAVWTLKNKSDVITNQLATPETIGMVMQLIMLVVSLFLTEYYIRKRHKKSLQSTHDSEIPSKEMVL
jgi:membrane protease YdiL (CAAX protease family)